MAGRLRVAVTLEQCWHRIPGGVGRATVQTTAALSARGDLDLVGVAAAHRPATRPALEPPIPVVHHRLPRPLLYDAWHRLGRPRLPRSVGPVDVVWAAAMAVPPPSPGAALVVTVHDLAFLDRPEWSTRRGLSFFRRSWDVTRCRADLLVVPSATTAADCVRHGFDPERVEVVPWGVDTRPSSDAEVAAIRRRFDLPDRFVLWVGTAEPRKNLPALVDAMGRVDLPLVVVGPAGWRLEPDAVLAPLGPRVLVLGELSDAELRAVYRAATVFAFPSRAEGFGLPVLEAMAQGTAVVTSARTATADVAGDCAVLIDPTGPEAPRALAAAIADLAGDDDRRRTMGDAGRAHAARFTWRATAEGYRDAFRRAAGGVRP